MNQELAADLERRKWERRMAPKALALLNRANEVDLTLPQYTLGANGKWIELNRELRRELDNLTVTLDAMVRDGHDIEGEFYAEVLTTLERAERLTNGGK